ncbi:MAG: hypothetical protein RBS17_10340 [Coriobacteriia bacterium]|nr:hypothetical protein [Coriobacteriia bacterium]
MHDGERCAGGRSHGCRASGTLAPGGAGTVPTLAETLALIDGQAPVFMEIKSEDDVGGLEDDVTAQSFAHDGEAWAMPFSRSLAGGR